MQLNNRTPSIARISALIQALVSSGSSGNDDAGSVGTYVDALQVAKEPVFSVNLEGKDEVAGFGVVESCRAVFRVVSIQYCLADDFVAAHLKLRGFRPRRRQYQAGKSLEGSVHGFLSHTCFGLIITMSPFLAANAGGSAAAT